MRSPLVILAIAALLGTAAFASVSSAAPPGAVNQAKDGWPSITGMLLINRSDLSRPHTGSTPAPRATAAA